MGERHKNKKPEEQDKNKDEDVEEAAAGREDVLVEVAVPVAVPVTVPNVMSVLCTPYVSTTRGTGTSLMAPNFCCAGIDVALSVAAVAFVTVQVLCRVGDDGGFDCLTV